MHQHPYFNLLLHDDEELVCLVGSKLDERVTLHEWPLSCVQRLTLSDVRRVIDWQRTIHGPTELDMVSLVSSL